MSIRTRTNINGKTGGGNIFYDKRFDLLYKVAKEQDIPDKAKLRLKWMDHHFKHENAALTCRYFGISESCFWKWKKRFELSGLKGLEDRSKRPYKIRKSEIPSKIIEKIDQLRKLYPTYGKEKISALLGEMVSESTVGRIIKRYNMFYRLKKKRRGHSWRWGQKQRIKNLVAHGVPGEHIQMDTIVLYRNSKAYYIKTAIDVVTKIAFAHCYTRNTSTAAVNFLQKLESILPYQILNIHTDNGSEFLGKFHEELEHKDIQHYFSYPHCPKQHGAIERFNRTLQEEFIQLGNMYNNATELNQKMIKWLIEYNFHRPHHSLGNLNPLEFYDQNFIIKSSTRPSSMYWTYTTH